MLWWHSRTLAQRLGLGFSALLVLMAVLAVTGFTATRTIQANVDDIFEVRLPAIDSVIEADRDLQQLLVAERSMIFAETASDVFTKLVAEYEENLKQSDTRWEAYKALATTPEERSIVEGYEKARREWLALSRQIVDGRRADTMDGRILAMDLTLGQAREKFDEAREFLNQAQELNLRLARQQHADAQATYRTARNVILLFGLLSVAVGLGLAWVIGNGTSSAIRRIATDLRGGSQQVVAAANEVASSAQHLSRGASDQAAALEETSAAMEEMASMTRRTAEHSNRAAELMVDVDRRMGESNKALSEMVGSMASISEASQRVSKIIKTIDEIAFQTNILALNAAVEAARAGAHGRGFAVVAAEVRSLAQRSASAAKEIHALIQDSVAKIGEGSRLADRSGKTLEEITLSARQVAGLIADIAAASREQSSGIEQVNQSVAQMDRGTQGIASQSGQLSTTSQALGWLAEELTSLVGRFQLADDLPAAGESAVGRPQVRQPDAGGVEAAVGRQGLAVDVARRIAA